MFKVTTKGSEVTNVVSEGVSFLPMIQYVETDGNLSTMELYVNTGLY